jgi:hypothetical protein
MQTTIRGSSSQLESPANAEDDSSQMEAVESLSSQIASFELTQSEQLQVLCTIVRDQIDVGNYEAGCKILRPWWSFGNSPRIDGLTSTCCADLLLTGTSDPYSRVMWAMVKGTLLP